MRIHVTRWIAPLLLAALAACARGQGDGQPAPMATTTVRVDNRSFVAMTIYVLQSNGSRRRLGEVSGSSARVFEIPRGIVFGATTLRFLADPIGSDRTPISQDIIVTAGDQVNLVIQN